jgi:hypothetical protein
VRLMERLIALVSDPGNVILDPFAGSGSTLLAARRTGRKFLGMEIDDEYHALAARRLRDDAPLLNVSTPPGAPSCPPPSPPPPLSPITTFPIRRDDQTNHNTITP